MDPGTSNPERPPCNCPQGPCYDQRHSNCRWAQMKIPYPNPMGRFLTQEERYFYDQGLPVPSLGEWYDEETDEIRGPDGHVLPHARCRIFATEQARQVDAEARALYAGIYNNLAAKKDWDAPIERPDLVFSRVRIRTSSCPPPRIYDRKALMEKERMEAARIPAAVLFDSNQELQRDDSSRHADLSNEYKKKNASGQHGGKRDPGHSDLASTKWGNGNMQEDRQKKLTRWLPTLAETLGRDISKEVADNSTQLVRNKKQNVEVIGLTAEENPSPEPALQPLVPKKTKKRSRKGKKRATQEDDGQKSRRIDILAFPDSNLPAQVQEVNQPSGSTPAPEQSEFIHPSRQRLLDGDKILSTDMQGEDVTMKDTHGETVITHEGEIASKAQPAKRRALYLSLCLSKSYVQLPGPNPQPTRFKIKGTDACVKGRRISKLLSKKHNDDTWDTEDAIVYAPKTSASNTQPAGFSSEPIIYWDALLNNSVVHGYRAKLVSRITAMSLEHQWRAVGVWVEWVQNKGVNIAGEEMKHQAIDVGDYLEASNEYMELLRAS